MEVITILITNNVHRYKKYCDKIKPSSNIAESQSLSDFEKAVRHELSRWLVLLVKNEDKFYAFVSKSMLLMRRVRVALTSGRRGVGGKDRRIAGCWYWCARCKGPRPTDGRCPAPGRGRGQRAPLLFRRGLDGHGCLWGHARASSEPPCGDGLLGQRMLGIGRSGSMRSGMVRGMSCRSRIRWGARI